MPHQTASPSLLAPPVTVIATHGNGGGSCRFPVVATRFPDETRFVASLS